MHLILGKYKNKMWSVPRKYMLMCFEQHQSILPYPAAHQFALPANLEGDQGGKSPRRSQFQILTTLKEELHHLLFSN